MKTLVVYFSHTGKTKALAEKIAEMAEADIFELVPQKPYPTSYIGALATSIKEIICKARPAFSAEIPNLGGYDRVLLGAPVWCLTLPNIVLSFLEQADLRGKKTALFTTSDRIAPDAIAQKLKKRYAAAWKAPLNGNELTDEILQNWLK